MGWRWCSWLASSCSRFLAGTSGTSGTATGKPKGSPKDRATSGDPLRAAHGEVQARVRALLLVELLATALPELAAGFASFATLAELAALGGLSTK